MKKLLAFLFVIAATVSCSDDIKPEGDFSQGPKIVGFGTNFESVAYFQDIGVVEKSFPVNLIGLGNGQTSSEPIQVSYEIDTVNSTATEGVEFNFTDSSGIITIPAGGTFGNFPLNVNTGNFNPTEKTQLILKLTSATGETVVGMQYSTLRIVFVGCQSQLEGNYSLHVVRNDGFVRDYASEDVMMTAVNTFHTTSTGTYLPGQFAVPDQGFNFVDICGDITVPSQNLADYYSNLVRGKTTDGTDGLVSDDGNSFTITYEITFAAGNRTYTATYTRNN